MKKIVTLGFVLTTIVALNGDDFRIVQPSNKLYIKECGSCHMPFSPSLLNQKGWVKMVDNLGVHFGTDASLEPLDTKTIKDYLVQNSNNGIKNPTNEIAITKTPWFKREHRKIKDETIKHEKIKTLSNCVACHSGANKGNFEEDEIKIPGLSWFHH